MEGDLSRRTSKRIDAKIKEKTGLSSKKAIQAYIFFYSNTAYSSPAKGRISEGGVQSWFYDSVRKEILEKEKIRNLETLDNKRKEKVEERINDSVKRRYNYWYNCFRDKGLISDFSPRWKYQFPMLVGYNPSNDREFHIPYKSKGDTRWTGRISRDFLLNTPGELERRRKKLGEVFKI